MKNFWLIFFVIALIEFFVVKILVCCFRKAVIFLRTQRNIYKRKDADGKVDILKNMIKTEKLNMRQSMLKHTTMLRTNLILFF